MSPEQMLGAWLFGGAWSEFFSGEKLGNVPSVPNFVQIVENAGQEGAVVLGKVLDSKDANFGFNALNDEYEDLVKAGVLDPTKVVRTALTNAGSIASLMLTTEALVAEIPEKKEAPMPGGHGGGGMEGMY